MKEDHFGARFLDDAGVKTGYQVGPRSATSQLRSQKRAQNEDEAGLQSP